MQHLTEAARRLYREFDQLATDLKKKRFDEVMGADTVREKDTFYYPNGALFHDHADSRLIAFSFPPDPREGEESEYLLHWRIRKFHELKLDRAKKAFERLQEQLASVLPSNEEAALNELKQARAVVVERKEALATADADLKNTRRVRAQAQRLADEEERRQRFDQFQSKRRAISI